MTMVMIAACMVLGGIDERDMNRLFDEGGA